MATNLITLHKQEFRGLIVSYGEDGFWEKYGGIRNEPRWT